MLSDTCFEIKSRCATYALAPESCSPIFRQKSVAVFLAVPSSTKALEILGSCFTVSSPFLYASQRISFLKT